MLASAIRALCSSRRDGSAATAESAIVLGGTGAGGVVHNNYCVEVEANWYSAPQTPIR